MPDVNVMPEALAEVYLEVRWDLPPNRFVSRSTSETVSREEYGCLKTGQAHARMKDAGK
jgi:hypothetical protein